MTGRRLDIPPHPRDRGTYLVGAAGFVDVVGVCLWEISSGPGAVELEWFIEAAKRGGEGGDDFDGVCTGRHPLA